LENFEARGMHDVTTYAPLRIATLGLIKAVFGLLLAAVSWVILYVFRIEPSHPRHPGDMPEWWMAVSGVVFGFVAFCFISGSVGGIVSAFAKNCYFKAGPEGIAVRITDRGMRREILKNANFLANPHSKVAKR